MQVDLSLTVKVLIGGIFLTKTAVWCMNDSAQKFDIKSIMIIDIMSNL